MTTRVRNGVYPVILETRISERQYRQLKKIAEILHTNPSELLRYLIELKVWETYGIEE